MKRVLSALLFFAVLLFPSVQTWSSDNGAALLPEGEGKEETQQLCTSCHNLQRIVLSRKTPQEWEKTVYGKVARGAQIFPDEAEKIIKYLSKSFPSGKPAN